MCCWFLIRTHQSVKWGNGRHQHPRILEVFQIASYFLHFHWNVCVCVCMHVHTLSHVWLFGLWTVAHQAPLSMGCPRQEYWNRLPFPTPGDLPEQSTTMGCRLTKTATCFLGPVSPALTLGTKFVASCSFSHSILKAILCSHYHFVYFTDKELQVQRGQ